jgi:hypothetical protein
MCDLDDTESVQLNNNNEMMESETAIKMVNRNPLSKSQSMNVVAPIISNGFRVHKQQPTNLYTSTTNLQLSHNPKLNSYGGRKGYRYDVLFQFIHSMCSLLLLLLVHL